MPRAVPGLPCSLGMGLKAPTDWAGGGLRAFPGLKEPELAEAEGGP